MERFFVLALYVVVPMMIFGLVDFLRLCLKHGLTFVRRVEVVSND